MDRKNNKKDKNPSKGSKPTQQPRQQQQGQRSSQSQQGQGSSQSQQRNLSSQQQSEWSVAGRGRNENLQQGRQNIQEDEWKSSQRPERSQGRRSEQGPGERGPQPHTQQQQQPQWRTEQQRSSYQQQGAWQHQDRGQQPWRSQSDKGQMPRKQKAQGSQQGAWSQPHDKRQGGFSRAGSTQSKQSKEQQGASSSSGGGGGGDKMQQKRPEPLTNEDLKKLNIDELQVEYKGPGKNGKSLGKIETNYVKLQIKKILENIYHYDVSFDPERPKKFLTKAFTQFIEKNFPEANVFIGFDGTKNAYASQQLKVTNLQHDVKLIHPVTGKGLNFKVDIQEAKNSRIPFKQPLTTYKNPEGVDPNVLKCALQGLEVILKAAFHQEHVKRGLFAGRSFFVPPDMLSTLKGKDLYLGDGCQLWLGLFQAVVLGDELFLNVDVSHKALPKPYPNLIELLKDLEGDMMKSKRLRDPINLKRPLDRKVLDALGRQLSGLDVCYTQPGTGNKSIRKFIDVVEKPSDFYFNSNGTQTSVLKYFTERGMKIEYLEMPCIRIGNKENSITVPMEFCSIPTQAINKKSSENQTRNIIRHAATSTDDRKKRIMNVFNEVKHNESKTIRGFGINVDQKFIEVNARQLDAPIIQYKNAQSTPKNGVWNPVKMEFLITEPTPQTGLEWGILNCDNFTGRGAISELCDKLHKMSMSNGVNMAPRPSYTESVISSDERFVQDYQLEKRIRSEFEKVSKRDEIKILFCVIPDNGQIYGKIKKMAEIDHGILTQCLKGKTVKRDDLSTISNILLKVNTKLNGTNHKLETCPILTGAKCMFIGADVTHPSPDQTAIPSVVGVTASYDSYAFRYAFYWRLQGPKIEIIEDFKKVIMEHLKMYKKENKVLPDKIFYYRDGVSEGQFSQVMAIEKNAMVQACREIEAGYEKKVKITVVVVQKRHHTRFFPGRTGISNDKNNNVPAGTIVDTVITRPNENQFYLVSHQSIQGVAKPTKYCILLDEENHNIDDLQGLTNNLCYLFTRCNRAVSYPAPTYYAHLAAYRGRVYIGNDELDLDNLDREWKKLTLNEKISKGYPMFFV